MIKHPPIDHIPMTGDMVSLWLPSGQNRAIDVIRSNHGQCYGTHPNVPVLPSLINPSVGWWFGGDDDFIDCGNNVSLKPANVTVCAWIYPTAMGDFDYIVSNGVDVGPSYGWGLYVLSINRIYWWVSDGIGDRVNTISAPISLDTWNYIVATYEEGVGSKLYVNGVLEASTAVFTGSLVYDDRNLYIGRYPFLDYYFTGSIALPFIANKAWSLQQVENFYLGTRSFFSPRG